MDKISRTSVGALALALFVLAHSPTPSLASPTWLPPFAVSGASHKADEPKIATDGELNTTALWREFDGANWMIRESVRQPGGSFIEPITLSSVGEDASEPELVTMPFGGRVGAVWVDSDGSNQIIQASIGETTQVSLGKTIERFGDPVDLSEGGEDAAEPQIALVPSGEAVAVWRRSDGSHEIIQAATRNPFGGWSNPVDLSGAGENASEPDVALSVHGEATVVWRRFNGSNTVIEASRRPEHGSFSSAEVISELGQDAAEPQVEANLGEATAVWTRSNGTNDIVQESKWVAEEGGGFSQPNDLSEPGGSAKDLQLETNYNGRFTTAIWLRDEGGHEVVQAATKENSILLKPFSPAVDISDPGKDAEEPALSIDGGGFPIAVVWRSYDGSQYSIEASIETSDEEYSPPVEISKAGPAAATPVVSVYLSTDVVAAWVSPEAGGTTVEVAGFDRSAPVWGGFYKTFLTVGEVDAFSIRGLVDLWSGIASNKMDFGDGSSTSAMSDRHFYCAGKYTFSFSTADGVGNSNSESASIQVAGSNAPEIQKFQSDPSAGTGMLRVKVPCPGTLSLHGSELQPRTVMANEPGNLELPIVATGSLKSELREKGSAIFVAELDFAPRAATSIAQSFTGTLALRLPSISQDLPKARIHYWRHCISGDSVKVNALLAHGVACGKAREVLGGMLKRKVVMRTARVQGFRCYFRSPKSFTCQRGARRIRARLEFPAY